MNARRKHVLSQLRRPAVWGWLTLACLPPELLSQAYGWELVDPAYLAVLLLWWPLDTLGRLGALGEMLSGDGFELRSPLKALPSALAAEILVGLRSGVLALAGLVPGIALLSYVGLEHVPRRLAVIVLLLLGLLPSLLYALRRLLAPRFLMLAPMKAAEALNASAQALQNGLRPFLLMAAPFIVASWCIDGLGLALPWGVALVLGPLGLALSLLPLALFGPSPRPERAENPL
jgi:hypothetical protein